MAKRATAKRAVVKYATAKRAVVKYATAKRVVAKYEAGKQAQLRRIHRKRIPSEPTKAVSKYTSDNCGTSTRGADEFVLTIAHTSRVDVSQLTIPQLTIPRVDVPQLTVPRVHVPQLTIPKTPSPLTITSDHQPNWRQTSEPIITLSTKVPCPTKMRMGTRIPPHTAAQIAAGIPPPPPFINGAVPINTTSVATTASNNTTIAAHPIRLIRCDEHNRCIPNDNMGLINYILMVYCMRIGVLTNADALAIFKRIVDALIPIESIADTPNWWIKTIITVMSDLKYNLSYINAVLLSGLLIIPITRTTASEVKKIINRIISGRRVFIQMYWNEAKTCDIDVKILYNNHIQHYAFIWKPIA